MSTTVQGLPDLKQALYSLPAKLRFRALRMALTAAARIVQKEVRLRAPILKLSTQAGFAAFRRGVRKPRTVQKAISVRTSKVARRRGNVGVFVNVRPAKGIRAGTKNPNDPFYWRFINFGWTPASNATGGRGRDGARLRARLRKAGAPRAKEGARFMEAGPLKFPQALQEFLRRIGPAIAKLNRPKAPPP